MKNLLLVVPVILFSDLLVAQSKPLKAEEAVKQLIADSSDEVWLNLNAEKIRKYHTNDFILLKMACCGIMIPSETIRQKS